MCAILLSIVNVSFFFSFHILFPINSQEGDGYFIITALSYIPSF